MLSCCQHILPDSLDLSSDQTLSCSEEEFLSCSGMTFWHYCFDQYNADPARAALGRGTSACVYIQGKLAHRFLTNGVCPDLNQAEVAKWVQEYDDSGASTGSFMVVLLKDICKTTPDLEMLVSEYVNPQDYCQPVKNFEGSKAAMLHQLAEHPLGNMVILFTNPTIGSTGTGNTHALFISKNGNLDRHVFLDTPAEGRRLQKAWCGPCVHDAFQQAR